MSQRQIGMILFDGFTALDFTGPYEVFSRTPGWNMVTVAREKGLIVAEGGVSILASSSIKDNPLIDILFIPGGKGINELLTDQLFLEFIQRKGSQAEYVTSVCTGSLVLAAASLLDGYRATTHWRYLPLLGLFPVKISGDRVVRDRNRITGGGVTAGIDFALYLVRLLEGKDLASRLELILEYNPRPPMGSGHPDKADPQTLEQVIDITSGIYREREQIIRGLLKTG